MAKKIVILLVCTILITYIVPLSKTQKVEENEIPSCDLANIISENEKIELQIQNNLYTLNELGITYYGYCAWDPSTQLVQGPVYFNPSSPETITQIAPTISTEFISGGTWAVGKWYGCEFASGIGDPLIWTLHPVIGTMTQVGSYDPNDTGLSLNGLAYNPANNIMYGCSATDLYTINMTTGASSWVGNFDIAGIMMIAIAFDGSGNLFGTDIITDSLYSINPSNGEATKIGNGLGINLNYAQDMAFDLDTDKLYLSAYTTAPQKEGALYTCNKNTGVATKIGTFQGGAEITGFAIPYCGILRIIPTNTRGGIIKTGQSKIQFSITNTGGLPCTDVSMAITSKRSLIFTIGNNPIISTISPGETLSLTSANIFGIGLRPEITIIVNETSCGSTDAQTKRALLFGLLISY